MNYLAHAYLSFGDPEILLGNMISDFVKGKKQFDYPKKIQAGIRLHRAIDNFTDNHPATKQLKEYFRPHYRLYAGAFVDIVYDHFLANDAGEFEEENSLADFTGITYEQLGTMATWHGYHFSRLFPYMSSQDWLLNYRQEWGIQKSFEGMRRRASYIEETHTAFSIFVEHKKQMLPHYNAFFPSVKNFAAHTLTELLKY